MSDNGFICEPEKFMIAENCIKNITNDNYKELVLNYPSDYEFSDKSIKCANDINNLFLAIDDLYKDVLAARNRIVSISSEFKEYLVSKFERNYLGDITLDFDYNISKDKFINKFKNFYNLDDAVFSDDNINSLFNMYFNKSEEDFNFLNVSNTSDTEKSNIIIPVEYGNSGFFTYTNINGFNWQYDQKKVYNVWKENGENSENNIAVLDGRYLIACTNTFGKIGDYIDFYLDDGTKLKTIMFDEKSQEYTSYDHNPANKWGHNDGQQIIEFEITNNPNGSGDVGSWIGLSGKSVIGATNLEKNILNDIE